MCLFEQILRDRQAARITRNKTEVDILSVLIASLERDKHLKNPMDDAVVIAMCKKVQAGVQELLTGTFGDSTVMQEELAVLERYIPKQLDDQEIHDLIIASLEGGTPATMGALMKALKAQHEGQFDGKMASLVIKGILNAKSN